MVALANTLLTDIEDVNEAFDIEMMWDGHVRHLCGFVVRAFVAATNEAYSMFPGKDCLADGLELIPPEMRDVFEYLYEELKEVIE